MLGLFSCLTFDEIVTMTIMISSVLRRNSHESFIGFQAKPTSFTLTLCFIGFQALKIFGMAIRFGERRTAVVRLGTRKFKF